MATTVTKIKAWSSDNDELVEQCKQETSCGDCISPEWITITPPNFDYKDPPAGTVAVVVDVRNYTGAMRIFESETNEFLGGVGSEDKGDLMIVPWNSNWKYFCAGSLRVGYIVKKS